MATFNYFAYGSNILAERLQNRCSSAEFKGLATAIGYDIDFSKISKDGSGKATIFSKTNSFIYGALFTITQTELRNLDKAEGKGYGYDRIDAFDVMSYPRGELIKCVTYQACPKHRENSLFPFDWYHQLVIAGMKQGRFPQEYLEKTEAVQSINDNDPNRKTRNDAIRILAESGYPYHPN